MTSRIAINVEIPGLATPTCKLFANGSDTIIETIVLTEATNRAGWYIGDTVTTATGLYLVVVYTGTDALGSQYVRLTNTSPVEDVASDIGDDLGDSLYSSYADLNRAVGRLLGLDGDSTAWTTAQTADVADVVRSGLRAFYWPSVGDERYTWSFLRQTGTINVIADDDEYPLPDDFGGSMSGLTFAAGTGLPRIARVSEEAIRSMRAAEPFSGPPKYCALSVVQPGLGASSSYQLLLYPTPDKSYTLTYRYAIEPDLDGTVVHLGGAIHSETVLEAVLAAAEKTLRPELGQQIHAAKFAECLQASLKIDSEML